MKKSTFLIIALVAMFQLFTSESCDVSSSSTPISNSGVNQVKATVQTDPNGHTNEQNNILERYRRDNLPGSIKHLYVISPLSGQVLIYSTVKGKVTSSGKRLTPTTVTSYGGEYHESGIDVNIGGNQYETNEVLQDDGTYGSSIEYLYWFDSKNVYHQQYMQGCIIHISDQPLAIKSVVLNLEESK